VEEQPHLIQLLLDNYFRVLKFYRDKPAQLQAQVSKETGLDKQAVENMLKGVKWANFGDNCEKWFGISAPGSYAEEGLVDTIMSTTRILINSGDFKRNPIPDDDPYRITNSMFLETLFARGISGFTTAKVTAMNTPGAGTLAAFFEPLDDDQWRRLREVGTLKIDPIVFQHGATDLDRLAKQVVDEAVERLKHYPNFRILINGHTGTRGDAQENLRLSQERAESVARYLQVVYNVNQHRIKPQGYGGTKPLKRQQGESRRAWSYRLPRVELVLAREDY
jgi:outer membrane protein OmpA-like peptidoglycan-associated protein